MDDQCEMQYTDKIMRAAIIAIDGQTSTASEYLLGEIPWDTLPANEILKLTKMTRDHLRIIQDDVHSIEVK